MRGPNCSPAVSAGSLPTAEVVVPSSIVSVYVDCAVVPDANASDAASKVEPSFFFTVHQRLTVRARDDHKHFVKLMRVEISVCHFPRARGPKVGV